VAGVAPWSLPNVPTSDGYTGLCTIDRAPNGKRYVSLQVLNAAIYYQLQFNGTWEDYETFLGPWVGTLDRPDVTGFRARSALAGSSAQVTCSLGENQDNGSVPAYTISPSGSVMQSGGGDGVVTGDIVWSAANSRSGAVPADGSFYNSVADPTFAALYAAIGITYGGTGPSHFAVPDVLDRVPVGAGRNTALGGNEGVAATNRHATRHRQTAVVNDPGHANGLPLIDTGNGYQVIAAGHGVDHVGDGLVSDVALTGITVTVGVSGSDPLDGPAFLGLNPYIIK